MRKKVNNKKKIHEIFLWMYVYYLYSFICSNSFEFVFKNVETTDKLRGVVCVPNRSDHRCVYPCFYLRRNWIKNRRDKGDERPATGHMRYFLHCPSLVGRVFVELAGLLTLLIRSLVWTYGWRTLLLSNDIEGMLHDNGFGHSLQTLSDGVEIPSHPTQSSIHFIIRWLFAGYVRSQQFSWETDCGFDWRMAAPLHHLQVLFSPPAEICLYFLTFFQVGWSFRSASFPLLLTALMYRISSLPAICCPPKLRPIQFDFS